MSFLCVEYLTLHAQLFVQASESNAMQFESDPRDISKYLTSNYVYLFHHVISDIRFSSNRPVAILIKKFRFHYSLEKNEN